MNPNLKYFLFRWGGAEGGGARVSEYFSKNPNLKKKNSFFLAGGPGQGVAGGGGLELVNFFSKSPNLKNRFFFCFGGGEVGARGSDFFFVWGGRGGGGGGGEGESK